MEDVKALRDEQIIERIRQGETSLFREIVERYHAKLLRFAERYVRSRDVAEDVVQEAFIKAYRNLWTFDTSLMFSSWIYRIVRNEAINSYSKARRVREFVSELAAEAIDVVELSHEMVSVRQEEREMVARYVKDLPVAYREPLELFFFEEKKYEEISEILHIPVSTVGIRIMRAKALIKKRL